MGEKCYRHTIVGREGRGEKVIRLNVKRRSMPILSAANPSVLEKQDAKCKPMATYMADNASFRKRGANGVPTYTYTSKCIQSVDILFPEITPASLFVAFSILPLPRNDPMIAP